HLHRARSGRKPARPADRRYELAFERGQRAVGACARAQLLDGRVAVAGVDVLLAPRQSAPDGATRALRELRGDERVVVGPVLRAEPAAHELADDAHLVGRAT